jgi:branched-chain amino acid transport system substrate-binding protein
MRASWLAATALAAIALVVGGCGEASRTFTIGVITDCEGVFSAYSPDSLAGAELPLLERGGRLAGRGPGDGVKGTKVAGSRVELVQGCAEITYLTQLIENVRRLIEADGANVVVAPLLGQTEGVVLQELARRYPKVTFVLANSYAQEPTLRDPVPNLYRFVGDGAQSEAGLGSYAYHELGWRTAALVLADNSFSWPEAAGFIAEFCALGGQVQRVRAPDGDAASVVPRLTTGVDGVALLSRSLPETAGFASSYAKLRPDLARHLVLGPGSLFGDLKLLPKAAPLLRNGVLSGSSYDSRVPAWLAFRDEFHKHFPGLTALPSPAGAFLVVGFYNAVEATVRALERARRDGEPLGRALAATSFDAPNGPLRLDHGRQAVVTGTLSRIDVTRKGPAIRTIRVLPGVEQTFAGYFGPSSPTPTVSRPGCHAANVPPWAR